MQKYVLISNQSRANEKLIRTKLCEGFKARLRGLMFRRSLQAGEGVLLIQKKDSVIESSIHMLFMFMDLTVVWINSASRVVDVKHAKPWRLAYFPKKPACYVLEISLDHLDLFKIGDYVAFHYEPVA